MSMLKDLLNETRKVNENDLFGGPDEVQTPPEVEQEMPTEEFPTEEFATEEFPEEGSEENMEALEITDELIAELASANPAISEVDPMKFKCGLEKEIKHLEAVGGDINLLANIVLDNINAYPDKDYYAALGELEASLMEPTEEMGTEEMGEEEFPAEEVVEEPASAPVFAEEPVVEEGKGQEALSQKTQNDGKAMSQVKNESATATHPDEKKDEKNIAKDEKMSKEEEAKMKTDQAKDDKSKNVAEAVGADKQAKGSVKSAEKDEKMDASKTKAQAAAHKTADKVDMNKKDVNPKQK